MGWWWSLQGKNFSSSFESWLPCQEGGFSKQKVVSRLNCPSCAASMVGLLRLDLPKSFFCLPRRISSKADSHTNWGDIFYRVDLSCPRIQWLFNKDIGDVSVGRFWRWNPTFHVTGSYNSLTTCNFISFRDNINRRIVMAELGSSSPAVSISRGQKRLRKGTFSCTECENHHTTLRSFVWYVSHRQEGKSNWILIRRLFTLTGSAIPLKF